MVLPRLQLFELEDLAWFPCIVRDYATDYLQYVQSRLRLHEPVVPFIERVLQRHPTSRIVDLCSGGAGPLLAILAALQERGLAVSVTLTDRFPNLEAFERARQAAGESLDYVREPVDARSVPSELVGLRTIFNAFHHFDPHDAATVLQDAVAAGQPIAIFELPERTTRVILQTLLAPLMVLLATPFIKPFRWRRLLLTYVVPAVPLTCLWDGIVSQWRAYTPAELERLGAAAAADYDWTAGQVGVRSLPARVTYLVGCRSDPG